MKTETPSLHHLLHLGLTPIWARVQRRPLQALAERYRRQGGTPEPSRLLRFLAQELDDATEALYRQRQVYAEFNRRYAKAVTDAERAARLLDMAEQLGAGRWRRLGDRLALRRWLDKEAIFDRYLNRQAEQARTLSLLLERIGALAAWLLQEHPERWRALDVESLVRPLLAFDGDERVRVAAFKCLATALRALPAAQREGQVQDATLRYIYRATQTREQAIWIQVQALRLLLDLAPERFITVLERRLQTPAAGDDFFVRAGAVGLLGAAVHEYPSLQPLFDLAAADPSPYVRQSLVRTLGAAPDAIILHLLPQRLHDDPEPSVRASAAAVLGALLERPTLPDSILTWLRAGLERETDSTVLRMLLEVAALGRTHAWRHSLLPVIERLHREAPALAVRRWAAQTRELLWLRADPERLAVYEQLLAWVAQVRPGRRRRLPRALWRALQAQETGRLLALAAREDYPLELIQGLGGGLIQRGHRSGFRLWRLLHELRHPAPDKRQAFSHTHGRLFQGLDQAPATGLDELAPTKVPGEPLHMADEQGWRPYLPLLDQVISSLDQGWPTRPLSLYTAEGVTELRPPSSLPARLLARARLTLGFARLAPLRNWTADDQAPPSVYLEALRTLGFEVRLRTYSGPDGQDYAADPAVTRFFPAVLPLGLESGWERGWDYFLSVYENTLQHLLVFLVGVTLLFTGQHLWRSQALRAARDRIPLVVGGWGTRGKSGTERLKAALFNALGQSLVSKTTGCEAMFLYAAPYRPLREMYLFRPYDKATIWEQADVVRLAARLGSEVFLWECMGLTPDYVYILQRQWMRDDLSTITNTYPDHEDLQGPAGIDIPHVMLNFIPERSTLITSEEPMRPILRAGAEALGTRTLAVGWREACQLTPDVLARFPYQEHPYNIALVLRLARELDLDEDYALKEMADRVVPDLGVLKIYPAAWVEGRWLEFAMGMSANERYGALGNWQRLGFDRHARAEAPGIWITTVVNNRADRVPRSRVFANLLVNDFSADRHLLIGNNLTGLLTSSPP